MATLRICRKGKYKDAGGAGGQGASHKSGMRRPVDRNPAQQDGKRKQ